MRYWTDSSLHQEAIKNSRGSKQENSFNGFSVKSLDSLQQVKKIYIRSFRFDLCPICGARLYKSDALIQYSSSTGIAYPFFSCGHHFYAWPSKKLNKILNTNKNTKKIEVDRCFYYSKPEMGLFDNAVTACPMPPVTLLLLANSLITREILTSEILIIADRTETVSDRCHIIHYAEDDARRILTDIFHSNLSNDVEYNEKNYSALRIRDHTITHSMGNAYDTVISEIVIKTGGGFRYHIKNNHSEIIDVLLFSPRTKRYEIVHATYDKDEGYYYLDISLFRNFVQDYGNPGINIYTSARSKRAFFNDNLNDESILHAYGYTANSVDNLSDQERQSIIAEVIDLKLMTQKQIVDFLDWLSHRKNVYPETSQKWKRDKVFTINYKANPSRFLIYE